MTFRSDHRADGRDDWTAAYDRALERSRPPREWLIGFRRVVFAAIAFWLIVLIGLALADAFNLWSQTS